MGTPYDKLTYLLFFTQCINSQYRYSHYISYCTILTFLNYLIPMPIIDSSITHNTKIIAVIVNSEV